MDRNARGQKVLFTLIWSAGVLGRPSASILPSWALAGESDKLIPHLSFFGVLFYSPFLFPRRVESSVLLFFSQQIVSFVSSSAKYKNKHVSLTSIISNGGGRPRWDGQSTSYKQTHVVYQESFLNAFESFLYNGKDLTWRFLSLMDGKLTANPSGRTKVGRWGTKNYIESLF